jgi:hypothetical protein
VDADKSWCAMKKRLDHTQVSNDTVRGLVWIDRHLDNSINMVYSIYHCIRSLLPEEGAQVVRQINKAEQGHFHFTEAVDSKVVVADSREVTLALYLEGKSQKFPQVGPSHLESLIRLLNMRMMQLPQCVNPPPFIRWPLYDVVGTSEGLYSVSLIDHV